jgi:tetratricopeptide (TPR) repeat protein
MPLYERALALRAGVGADHTAEATRARVALVDLLQRTGDHDVVAQQLAIAAADADGLGEPELVALVLVHRCNLAIDRGEQELAAEFLARARPVAEEVGGRVLVELLLTRAFLEETNENFAAGLASAGEALERSRTLGDGELELRALNLLAVGASHRGRHDEAERHGREAMTIAGRLGNTARQAMLLGSLGAIVHVRAADDPAALADAIELYQESFRMYDDLGLDAGTIISLGNLAQAEIEGGLLDDGAHHARDHLRWAHVRGLIVDVGFGVLVHGQLAIARGDVDRGLWLMGVVTAHPRAEPRPEEVARILRLYRIPPDVAEMGMAAGRALDLDAVVEELLNTH